LRIPRLVIAGSTSGVGKTSITSAIIFGLKKKGYSIQPFKVGPDYIDPSYLTSISKNETKNLDVWLMGKEELIKSFTRNSKSDISIIEGVMGYYDGFGGKTNLASTHHVATLLNSPTILILDASKTSRSIAATALGFTKFHKNSRISGIILNKIGSKKHENLCKSALQNLKIPIIGVIPKNPSINLESRHLGLIPVGEQMELHSKIRQISKDISDHLDFNLIEKICMSTSSMDKIKPIKTKKSKISIAIALDNSFNFYYHDNIQALQREGAKIIFFSPINDKKIPNCDLIYLGGGFPEVLASSLAKNSSMKKSIKNHAENSTPIYAECGGLMYLTNSITYGNKKSKMVGLFDVDTIMTKKMTLNYTKGKINSNCIISAPHNFRAHEFHYSKIINISKDSKFLYDLKIGEGVLSHKDALTEYNTLASYCHLYFDSAKFASNLIENSLRI
jgi:cobyrinic acid a,c-diamide synthase